MNARHVAAAARPVFTLVVAFDFMNEILAHVCVEIKPIIWFTEDKKKKGQKRIVNLRVV